MIINGLATNAIEFAYDGCHKIYLIEDDTDKKEALNDDYDILPISVLEEIYENSCELRFIHNWKLNKTFVAQFETAIFN